jgi:hypothetical protein
MAYCHRKLPIKGKAELLMLVGVISDNERLRESR